MRPSPVPSRRTLIVGLAGATAAVVADLALGGLGHDGPAPKPTGTPPLPPPSDPSWRSAAGDERALIAAYETAGRTDPALAPTLALPLAHHRTHLAALTRVAASSTSVPPTTTSSGPAPGAATVATRRAALGSLRARETAAATRRSTAAVGDVSGGALLAQIAAAEAVHADYLAAAIAAIRPPAPSSTSSAPASRPAARSSTPLPRSTQTVPRTTVRTTRSAPPPTSSHPPVTSTRPTPTSTPPPISPSTSAVAPAGR